MTTLKRDDADKIKAIISDKKTDAATRKALIRSMPKEERSADLYTTARMVRGVKLRFFDAADADEYERRAGQ